MVMAFNKARFLPPKVVFFGFALHDLSFCNGFDATQ